MKKSSISDWKEAIISGIRGLEQRRLISCAERKTGCCFGGHVTKAELGYGVGEGYDYTPSFNHIKKFCKNTNRIYDKSVMDLGCGKGYAMYLMSRYPFRHIYGVEKDKNLAWVAMENCMKFDKNERVSVIAADVVDLDNEVLKNVDFFYLYNPFPSNVLFMILTLIEKTADTRKEGAVLWYAQPDGDCLNTLLNNGNWKCTLHKRSLGQDIYEFSMLL